MRECELDSPAEGAGAAIVDTGQIVQRQGHEAAARVLVRVGEDKPIRPADAVRLTRRGSVAAIKMTKN
ncbi:hypothetical protein [Chondromyces crocatus]|uniref:hypothetical protein n=1 Tax=Chondromyces crocatus TaxID=52 RepID=UPI0012E1FF44|nr:hypothetical protein [Chondromyces crocatus]